MRRVTGADRCEMDSWMRGGSIPKLVPLHHACCDCLLHPARHSLCWTRDPLIVVLTHGCGEGARAGGKKRLSAIPCPRDALYRCRVINADASSSTVMPWAEAVRTASATLHAVFLVQSLIVTSVVFGTRKRGGVGVHSRFTSFTRASRICLMLALSDGP